MDEQPQIRKNFLNIKRPAFKLDIIIVVILIIGIIGATVTLFMKIGGEVSVVMTDESKIQIWMFILSFLIGFFGNLLSNIVWETRIKDKIKSSELSTLTAILAIGNPDITNAVLNELNEFNGRSVENYEITAVLTPYNPILNNRSKVNIIKNSYIRWTVKYSFQQELFNDELIFQFVRNRNKGDDEKLIRQQREGNNRFFKNEYYCTFNERSFKNLPEEDRIYKVDSLKINNQNIELSKRIVPNNDNIVEFFALKPSHLKIGQKVKIEYEVTYLMECSSFMFFVIDYPTKAVHFNLNYNAVKENIDISAYQFLSSKKENLFEHREEQGVYSFNTGDWIMPKSNFSFTWYRK